jgi:hypothetical protein
MVAMNESRDEPDHESNSRRRDRGRNGSSAVAGTEENLVGRLKGGAAEAVRQATLRVRAAGRQLEQSAGEMTQSAVEALRERAQSGYERQKGQAVARAARAVEVAAQTANALRAVKADNVAEYLDAASRRAGQATQYLEEHTVTQMIEDANAVARRNRAVAVGGMLVAGFALSRFLKASAARAGEGSAGEESAGETSAGKTSTKAGDGNGKSGPGRNAGRGRPLAAARRTKRTDATATR